MIKNFVDLLEKSNFQEAENFLKNNLSILQYKTDDGWSILQLISFYNASNILKYILETQSFEYINQDKYHPLFIALEEKNKNCLNIFFDSEFFNKIYWEAQTDKNENFLFYSLYHNLIDESKKLLENNVSLFYNSKIDLVSNIISKNFIELFDLINQQDFLSNYNEVWIKKSIQFHSNDIFSRLLPYSKLNYDELFHIAYSFKNIVVISEIIESGEFLPGSEQITKIIELISETYENEQIKNASKKIINYLFEINIPFNKFVNQQGQNALILSISNNNIYLFEELIKHPETINMFDYNNNSPLMYAIEKNNYDFVKQLLKKKANPNIVDSEKNTALIKSIIIGNKNIVEEILKYSPHINELNNQNQHALSLAIKNRRMDLVSSLIWAGADIAINPVQFIEQNDIFFFDSFGKVDRFNYQEEKNINNFIALTQLGFNLNQKNDNEDTFLLHFIKNGYLSNFKAILKTKVDSNIQDKDGNNALMCAAIKNNDDYFYSLLYKFSQIDLTTKNIENKNIYDIIINTTHHARLEFLINKDENIEKNNLNKSLLYLSKFGNLKNIENVLLDKIKDISNIVDENNNNLLMISLAAGNIKNFKFLLSNYPIENILYQKNKNNHNLFDLLEKLPKDDELSTQFQQLIKKKINEINFKKF